MDLHFIHFITLISSFCLPQPNHSEHRLRNRCRQEQGKCTVSRNFLAFYQRGEQEIRFGAQRRISSLVPVFASQSSLRQRAGRAGRQQNGQYFCILSKVRRGILPYNGGPAIERGDNSSM